MLISLVKGTIWLAKSLQSSRQVLTLTLIQVDKTINNAILHFRQQSQQPELLFNANSNNNRDNDSAGENSDGIFNWNGLLLGVQKSRRSRARQRQRMGNVFGKVQRNITICSVCGGNKLIHHFCRKCWLNTLESVANMKAPHKEKDKAIIDNCYSSISRTEIANEVECLYQDMPTVFGVPEKPDLPLEDIPMRLRRPVIPKEERVRAKLNRYNLNEKKGIKGAYNMRDWRPNNAKPKTKAWENIYADETGPASKDAYDINQHFNRKKESQITNANINAEAKTTSETSKTI